MDVVLILFIVIVSVVVVLVLFTLKCVFSTPRDVLWIEDESGGTRAWVPGGERHDTVTGTYHLELTSVEGGQTREVCLPEPVAEFVGRHKVWEHGSPTGKTVLVGAVLSGGMLLPVDGSGAWEQDVVAPTVVLLPVDGSGAWEQDVVVPTVVGTVDAVDPRAADRDGLVALVTDSRFCGFCGVPTEPGGSVGFCVECGGKFQVSVAV